MIDHRHKCIFVHIPKCGGSSLGKKFRGSKNISVIDHNIRNKNFKYLKDRVAEGLKGYVFTFSRNPWDRLVSAYFYLNQGEKTQDKIDYDRYLSHYSSFEDMVLNWNNILFNQIHFKEQYKWICDSNGELIPDFIGRFENLQEDFNVVCDKIGIPRQDLPHARKSKHKHYTEYYDDETRQIVAEKYAKDIEYFGYEFGE